MKIETIFEMWNEDSKIDKTNLSEESIKTPSLHNKYIQILFHEKAVLKKYESEYKVLRLQKYEFYTQGHTQETKDMGWQLPSIGKILKNDVNQYLEADSDLIKLNLKIGIQHEKVSVLESIIDSLNKRTFVIKNSIEFQKFQLGAT